MPIYLVTGPAKNDRRLVDATTKSVAINHVTRNTVTAHAVTASELVKLLAEELKVEAASGADNPEPKEGA